MSKRKIRIFLRSHATVLVMFAVLFGAVSILQFAVLGSLLNGFSFHEVQTYYASSKPSTIGHNPLQVPFTLPVHALLHVLPGSLFVSRLVAAGFGVVITVVFYAMAQRAYGRRIAVLATALFGSSSWLLHTSRLGTPDVLFLGLFALAAALWWLRQTHRPLAWLTCAFLSVGLLYVPGMIWFLGFGLLWQIRSLRALAWQRRWVGFAGAIIALGGIVPLAWAFYRTPSLMRVWAGLPPHWQSAVGTIRAIAAVPVHVLVRGPSDPEHWLGHLPMLGIFSSIMLIFGAYAFVRTQRPRILLGCGMALVLAFILIGLGGVNLILLAPFALLLVAAGMKDIWDRWLRVFPRNPIARAFGFGLLSVVAALACAYNIRAYFVAWPQSTTTEAAFTYRRP